MIAKLLVLAAIASSFVPTAPRATSLTKRFFFDQFIPNPEADAELDGYVGSAKAVLLGPAHGRRRRRRGRQDRARRREALHVHRGQPRREAQQGEAARVAQAPRRRRRAGADRRGLCGNQPVAGQVFDKKRIEYLCKQDMMLPVFRAAGTSGEVRLPFQDLRFYLSKTIR